MTRDIYLFHTTRSVLVAQRAAAREGIDSSIIPAPRKISSGCTLAITCIPEQTGRFEQLLNKLSIDIDKRTE